MKKWLKTLLALAATAALVILAQKALRPKAAPAPEGVSMLRVWVTEKEPAVSAWLRALAKQYEKATGQRVYQRLATKEEAEDARRGKEGVIPPDVLIAPGAGDAVALRGYALIVRDLSASPISPAPTSALFYRPSPSPGPSPSPAPTPHPASFSAVLAPDELMDALPGAVRSARPAADFSQGKADAALLTAGQAASLPFGYRAYALPDGAGLLDVCAEAFTDAGQRFRSFLRQDAAQRMLSQFGLYSPALRLYGPEDPLRALIESSMGSPDSAR